MTTINKAVHIGDLSEATTVTVSDVACNLIAVYINETISAHTVDIQDNGTLLFKIPASAVEGTTYDFKRSRFNVNLECIMAAAATGSITVIIEPLAQAGTNF